MENVLDVIRCEEAQKVPYATVMLGRTSAIWWETLSLTMVERNEEYFDWSDFNKYFLEEYCPQSVLDAIEENFLRLTQGWLIVTEYANKFVELSRFATYLVATEMMKAKQYVAGLRPQIRGHVVMTKPSTYREAVEAALLAEREYGEKREENKGKKRKWDEENKL